MQIAVTISDEIAIQAHRLGMTIEAYVQSLIEQAGAKSFTSQPRSARKIDDFFDAMADGSENLPPLPTVGFQRETFYEDSH